MWQDIDAGWNQAKLDKIRVVSFVMLEKMQIAKIKSLY